MTSGRRAGPGLVPTWTMVLIDRPERSDCRVDIYSPSDQPVTASAGVFSSTSPPWISTQNAQGRGLEPTELTPELDAAIAANLRELGCGG